MYACKAAVAVLLLFVSGCVLFSSITSGIEFKVHKIEDQNADLALPSNWTVSQSPFFQIQTIGSVKDYKNITFEYRGLQKSLYGLAEKNEYAKGWYDAFVLSYKNYNARIISKSRINTWPGIVSFEFIGEYKDHQSGELLWKMGKLHIDSNHVHAIYYTCSKKDFYDLLPLFEEMESRHVFRFD